MPALKKFSSFGFTLISRRERAFTLIELLVVISIIGVLSAIAMVALSTVSKNGRDAKRLTDLKTIQGALEQYYSDNSEYPGDIDPSKIYFNKLPKDPSSEAGRKYTYSAFSRDNNNNYVRCDSTDEDCVTYCVYATFENLDNICNESNRYIPNGECPGFTINNATYCVGDGSKDTANFALTPP